MKNSGVSTTHAPVSTPMAANTKFEKLDIPEVDQHLYQSMLGSLMYTAIGTHLDIMYAIHSLSQFLITPGPVHLTALKHMYHYLNSTQDLGITFDGNQLQDGLVTYSDSDWAGDLNSCRSVSGYMFILCGAVVAWSANKQMTLVLSSTKAKYMAMTHVGKEVAFLKHTLDDIGISISFPVPLLIDNQSAIVLVENPIFHARSRHIEVCHHWIREKVEDGTLQLKYVPTSDQVVDIFTKVLNAEKFGKFRKMLGLVQVSTC